MLSKEKIFKISKWFGAGLLLLLSIAIAISDLSAFFGFLSFLVLILLIIALIKPTIYKLKSRKIALSIFGGVFIVLFIIALILPSEKRDSFQKSQSSSPVVNQTTNSSNDTSIQKRGQSQIQADLSPLSEPIEFDSVTNFTNQPPKYPNTANAYKKEIWKADGRHYILTLQNKYDDIGVYLNGKVQTIGTYGEESCRGLNQCSGLDTCYNYSGKQIIFCSVPPKDSVIEFTGLPIIKTKDYYLSDVECKQILDELKEYQRTRGDAFPSNLTWRLVDQFEHKYRNTRYEPYYYYHLPDSYCGNFLKGFLETFILIR